MQSKQFFCAKFLLSLWSIDVGNRVPLIAFRAISGNVYFRIIFFWKTWFEIRLEYWGQCCWQLFLYFLIDFVKCRILCLLKMLSNIWKFDFWNFVNGICQNEFWNFFRTSFQWNLNLPQDTRIIEKAKNDNFILKVLSAFFNSNLLGLVQKLRKI